MSDIDFLIAEQARIEAEILDAKKELALLREAAAQPLEDATEHASAIRIAAERESDDILQKARERERLAQDRIEEALGKAAAHLESLRAELNETRRNLRAATEELASTRSVHESLQSTLAPLNAELSTAQEELSAVRKDLETARNDRHALESNIDRLSAEYRHLVENSPDGRLRNLDAMQADIDDRRTNLDLEEAAIEKRRNALRNREVKCREIEAREAQLDLDERRVRRALKDIDGQRATMRLDRHKISEQKAKILGDRRALTVERAQLEEDERKSRPHQDRTRIRTLQTSLMERREEVQYLKKAALRLSEKCDGLKKGLRVVTKATRKQGMSEDAIARWVQSSGKVEWKRPRRVVVVGSNPYEHDEFVGFLKSIRITAVKPGDEDAGHMVVGKDDWGEDEIDRQLQAREGDTLKVYSQEMFIAALVCGCDPFESSDRESLLRFAAGHAALQHLMKMELSWPSTECATLSDEGPNPFDYRVEQTPLHRDGYLAGKTARLTASHRQRTITLFFEQRDEPLAEPLASPAYGGRREAFCK